MRQRNRRIKNLKGEGLSDIIKFGSKIKEKFQQGIQAIKGFFFFPPNSLPNKSNAVYKRYQNIPIESISVRREPINKGIQKFLNIVSLGGLNKAKESLGYDDIFHLYLIVKLNGKEVLIEKNERINISDSFSKGSKFEEMNVPLNQQLTLSDLFNGGLKFMGEHDFYQYNASNNNCQDFLLGLLKGSNLGNESIYSFIKQSSSDIFKNLPGYMKDLSQGITDFAGKISQLTGGKKRRRK